MSNILNIYRKYGESLYSLCNGIVGYIVPAIENGRIVERTMLRYADASNRNRPFAWAGFDVKSGMLLYYKHCMAEDFMDTKQFPADTVLSNSFKNQRTAKQQQEYERQLWETYEKIREFLFEKELTKEQKKRVKEYKEQWELTVLLDLLPYYEALAPEFFKWVKEVSEWTN